MSNSTMSFQFHILFVGLDEAIETTAFDLEEEEEEEVGEKERVRAIQNKKRN